MTNARHAFAESRLQERTLTARSKWSRNSRPFGQKSLKELHAGLLRSAPKRTQPWCIPSVDLVLGLRLQRSVLRRT
jgi:hypothetical protein